MAASSNHKGLKKQLSTNMDLNDSLRSLVMKLTLSSVSAFLFVLIAFSNTGAALSQEVKRNATYTFFKHYQSLDALKQKWPRNKVAPYVRAVDRLPDLSNCLVEENNFHTFDWARLRTLEEVEVCVSWLGNSLGDAESISVWFMKQGFMVVTQPFKSGSPAADYVSINATWFPDHDSKLAGTRSPLTGLRARFREIGVRAGLSIGLEINDLGAVVNVATGYSRL